MNFSITYDIGSENVSIEDFLDDTPSCEIYFAFRENGNLPVVFDGLTFGVLISINGDLYQELKYPSANIRYISTDQFYLTTEMIDIRPGDTVLLEAWAENAGRRMEHSYEVLLPGLEVTDFSFQEIPDSDR